MAEQTIRFRIRPDGRVEEQVEGIQGEGCEQLTERIEARLGVVQQRRATSEAYATATSQQPQSLEQLGSTAS
jgi:hypothetical protein